MPTKKHTKYFDTDQRPVPTAAAAAIPSTKITPISRRRKYAHDFSAGRQLKRIMNAKGHAVWRRVPDRAIVFYGKTLSTRRTKKVNALGKISYVSNKNNNNEE
jgi:hypothetical protein